MRQRPIRYLVAVFCAFAVGAAGSCHVPPAAETRSYYMARNSASDAASLGCYNGDKSGRLSLFFGAPTTVGGTYGATAWGAPDLRLSDIENVVKNFIRGYAYCRTNGGHRLQIGVHLSQQRLLIGGVGDPGRRVVLEPLADGKVVGARDVDERQVGGGPDA